MHHIADLIEDTLGKSIRDIPGAGAAGGLGAGLIAFLNARLERGIEMMLNYTGFQEKLLQTGLVFTGEGRLDDSTSYGKVISGIAAAARKHDIPVVAITGSIGPGAEQLLNKGVTAYFSLCSGPMSMEEAMHDARLLLSHTAEQIIRLLRIIPYLD
jgi:glycerate 2-kinase